MGSYRLPAAPLSSEDFRGPEVLRPCLAAGLPLSAFGPKAAIHSSELDGRRQGFLHCPPSRSHCRPVRRGRSIDTRTTGTSANLSHIADIIRRPHVAAAMNSSSISNVQVKSLQRLPDLCHMRCVQRSQKKCPELSTRGAVCGAGWRFGASSPRMMSTLNDPKKKRQDFLPLSQ